MFRRWIVLILLLLVGVNVIHAQDDAEYRISHYLKADANGVQQVYQHPPMNSPGEARQITHAASDVLTYGTANDGLSLAYISGGQLWLQPIDTDEAEALAPVTATQFYRGPVYSQDGQYIAYPDKGVWLLDLATRKTRQILKDVGAGENGSNAADFRIYLPEQFALNNAAKVTKLIVDVRIWEWNTVGVYDLASGDFHLLEGQLHTDLLPLGDGKVLLYGNNGVGGGAALHIADSLDDINTNTKVFDFSMLSDVLFADQAVERVPGVVRVFGQTITANSSGVQAFYLDYDVVVHEVVQVKLVTLSDDMSGETRAGTLSPDGKLLPVYYNALVTDVGVTYGDFKLIDLEKDQTTSWDDKVGLFRWQSGYFGS